MKRSRDVRTCRRSGAAAVELAILLPFLALMFSAALDFGRIFHALQVLDTAAASGAAYAGGVAWANGYPATPADATAAATTAACADGATLSPALQPGQVAVSIAGGTATVTVTYDYPLLTAVLIPAGTVQLQRSATVPVAPKAGD